LMPAAFHAYAVDREITPCQYETSGIVAISTEAANPSLREKREGSQRG